MAPLRPLIDSQRRTPSTASKAPQGNGQLSGAAREQSPSSSPASEAAEGRADASEFSALDLRDRVVIMLLFDQIVGEERVAEMWTLWQQRFGGDTKKPLWRLLTMAPELDPELIYAEAARVYDIEEARINRRGALPLIETFHKRVPRGLWDRMVERRLVPIAESIQNHSHRVRLILASHDPTHPEVKDEIMPHLNLPGYELRYAPEMEIVELLAEAFPWKYKGLKEALAAERKLAAHHHDQIVSTPESTPAMSASGESVEEHLMEAPVNSSSIIAFFENMLVEAVRQKVQGVCIVANEQNETEFYFQIHDTLRRWHVMDHVAPRVVLATLKSAVIHADFTHPEETQQHVVKRWIDNRLVRFRVSALPSNDQFDLESIVVRVLN